MRLKRFNETNNTVKYIIKNSDTKDVFTFSTDEITKMWLYNFIHNNLIEFFLPYDVDYLSTSLNIAIDIISDVKDYTVVELLDYIRNKMRLTLAFSTGIVQLSDETGNNPIHIDKDTIKINPELLKMLKFGLDNYKKTKNYKI